MSKKIKPIKPVGDVNNRIVERDAAIQQLKHSSRLLKAIVDIKDVSEIIPQLDSIIFDDDDLHKRKLERQLEIKLKRIDRALKTLSRFLADDKYEGIALPE